jgi:hypothetical protein
VALCSASCTGRSGIHMTVGSRRSLYSGVLHVLTAGQRRGGAASAVAWCVGQQVSPPGLPFDSACILGHRLPACARNSMDCCATGRTRAGQGAGACCAAGATLPSGRFAWPGVLLLLYSVCGYMQPGQVHAAAAQGMCDQIMGAARRPTREVAWHSPTHQSTAA